MLRRRSDIAAKRPKTPTKSGLRTGKRRRLIPRWSLKKWILVGIPASFLFVTLLFGIAYALAPLPETSDVATAQSTIVMDRTGKPIARLHAEVDRVDVPLAQVSKIMQDAVLAAEDRDFYEHGGVSIPGVVRAAFTNVVRGKVVQGGSTITQQYVKNAYVGSNRTIWRKFREVIVATKLERSLSKKEILERYLNTVYFGRGAYGVEAAARTFFNVPSSKLTLPQAAYLAGAIRSPERYSHDLDLGEKRRNRVIRMLLSLKKISERDAQRAIETKLRVAPQRGGGFSAVAGAHFVENVRKELISRFGSDEVYRGGLRVTTTLDLEWQQHAERAVREIMNRPGDPEVALVAVDPNTGAVRVMVGGRTSFAKQQLNLATQGRRQPGSAFKPFVLAAAVEENLSIRTKFPAPAKITLETGFEPWEVDNYDRRDYGTLDLVQATENSVNTVYAQLITRIGPSKVVTAAHAAGITTKMSSVPSLALGTNSVTPLEMAGAYATFANGGMANETYLVSKVTDAKKKVLYERKPRGARGMAERTANTVAHVLKQVIERGTGRRADIGRPAGGKTGTTEEHADAWFGGFTPDLSTVVWMGHPQKLIPMNDVHGIQVVGGSFPAQIWHDFMIKALAKVPPRDFGRPSFGGDMPTITPSASASPSPSPSLPAPSVTVVPSTPPSGKGKNSPSPSPSGTSSPVASVTPSPSPKNSPP